MLREDARRLGLRDASDRARSRMGQHPRAGRARSLRTPSRHRRSRAAQLRARLVRASRARRVLDRSSTSARASISINIPALHIAGWFDTYLEGSIAGYLALREHAGTEFARENQYLIAGPWVHIPWGDRVGEATSAKPRISIPMQILLRWFNHWLKDSDAFSREPRIRYFALGANEWRTAAEWPADAAYPLYLHQPWQRQFAQRRRPPVALPLPGSRRAARRLRLRSRSPRHSLPAAHHRSSGPIRSVRARTGQQSARLHSPARNARNRNLRPAAHSSLCRHFRGAAPTSPPSSFAFSRMAARNLSAIGIARSSWLFRDSTIPPIKSIEWDFTLEPTAFVLAPGERLRLEIASSAFPLYDRNPSTAVPPQLADNWNWARSTQQVIHDAQYPSALFPAHRGRDRHGNRSACFDS